jgi:hypothetical protein
MLGVAGLYAVVAERLSLDRRQELRVRVSDSIAAGQASVNSLNVFLAEDPEIAVISSAALDFAVLGPAGDDPLRCPRFLYQQATQHTWPRVRVGILIGLLLLGDKRVTHLIAECWRALPTDERQRLAGAWSGYVYAAVVEFLLDWLAEEADPTVCAAIATNLTKMPASALAPHVLDIERAFPLTAAPPGQPVRTLGDWTFPEYGAIVARRLHAVAGLQHASALLPDINRAWAIE